MRSHSGWARQHVAGVEDVLRVQGLLDRAPHEQGGRVELADQPALLEQADAVLARDGVAEQQGGVEQLCRRVILQAQVLPVPDATRPRTSSSISTGAP